MYEATTLERSAVQEIALADGARMQVSVRGAGPRTVLIIDDRAPQVRGSAAGHWGGADWEEGLRVVQCDLRWAATGVAGLVPFNHELAAADRVAVLDALAVAEVDVVAVGVGVPQALALAAAAPERVRSLSLIDPLIIGVDRTWDDLAGAFDEAMRFVRAHGFEGLMKAISEDPMSSQAGPFGPQLAVDAELAAGLTQLGRERYVARVVAFRDGLYPDRPLISVTSHQIADPQRPVLVVAHPDRQASADVLAAELPAVTRVLPGLPEAPATWSTVHRFLRSVGSA